MAAFIKALSVGKELAEDPGAYAWIVKKKLPMRFIQRKLLFKAWNKETKLMMRLNSIECVRGELVRANHILLQFTGLYDKQEEEIYEMDVILIGSEKFIVVWDIGQNGWSLAAFSRSDITTPFQRVHSKATTRLCNYYETEMES